MTTGALVGWKSGKPQLVEAGNGLASMTAKFKELNVAIAGGKCEYDKVELYRGAFKTALLKKTTKPKKES
ncbi:hypothetical protein R83H12_00428 [Fibrobacteria bacterium R8-3-H12]